MRVSLPGPAPLSRVSAAVLAALAVLVAVFGFASPAFAHDELIGADPAAGSQVGELPAAVTMTFSGVLLDEPGATEVAVTDAAGTDLTDGAPQLEGTRLTQPLQGSASGTVTVTWRVVSSDGHPISDRFTFAVGDGATSPLGSQTPLPGPPMAATDMTWLWVAGAVLIVAVGGLVVVLLARKRRADEH